MRLFVAVEIEDAAGQVAVEIARKLRAAIEPALKARWVPPENMHLTVRFIGHVDDDRASELIDVLSRPLDIPSFDIQLGGCGVFPSVGAPRVLWIGVAHGLPGLVLMHEAFNLRLRPFGFEPESRPFSAHLTLARIKDARSGTGRAVHEALRQVTPTTARSHVTRATIFRSHLSPNGPRYEPVAVAELRADS
jgi:RNA 2',3'-cyclic 3'-phosphodiesterase